MSLVNKINYRRLDDLANEGYRLALTGTVIGPQTNGIIATPDILPPPYTPDRNGGLTAPNVTPLPAAEKFIIVTGYRISTDAAAPQLVTLSFHQTAAPNAVVSFFEGYVGGSAASADRVLGVADWRFGELGYLLAITCPAGNYAYTIEARISYSKVPTGYIVNVGAPGEGNVAHFGLESSLDRGSGEQN